jgi:hypothetical protein
MSEIPIHANICEIEGTKGELGAYYPVRLYAIPRVGELINLFSFIDQSTNHPPVKHYKVVQIVHDVYDVQEKSSKRGHHFVNIFVKPTKSKFFK